MSGVGGLLELYWNFIGVDRNFIGAVSLRYCYVIATLLQRYKGPHDEIVPEVLWSFA